MIRLASKATLQSCKFHQGIVYALEWGGGGGVGGANRHNGGCVCKSPRMTGQLRPKFGDLCADLQTILSGDLAS